MNRTLRVLLVEDSEDDALLVLRALQAGGYEVSSERVDTPEAMRAALAGGSWEIVTSDYSMPKFSGPAALELLRAIGLDLPFIIVSGTIGEDVAVAMMKTGVADYLLKDRLMRLPHAVAHALAEAAERRRLRQAETALRESVERFQLASRATSEFMWDLDLATGWTWTNEGYLDFMGWPRTQGGHTYQQWIDAIHPEDRSRIIAETEKFSAGTGSVWSGEYRVCRNDGTVAHVADHAYLLRDAAGRPVRMVGAMQDITARKQSESALRESEELFRTAMNSASIGMALVAPDGRWLRVNPALCQLVGYTEAELLASDFQSITHPDDLAPDLAYVHQMLRREITSYQMEKRYIQKEGQTVWVLLSVALTWHNDGMPRYFISQIQDISQRKQSELALRRSEANLHAAQAIAKVGSSEYNPATGEWTWSPELFRIFRLDPARGVPPRDQLISLVHPDYRDTFLRLYDLDHPAAGHVEFRIQLPDGSTLWTEQNNELIYDQEGRLVNVIGTALDITERKQAEAKIRELVDVLDLAPVAVVISDLAHRAVYWNKGAEQLFGWKPAKVADRTVEELYAPETLVHLLRARAATFEQGNWRGEVPFLTSDGRRTIVELVMSLIRDDAGRPKARLTIGTDITEKKQLEEHALRAQRIESLGTVAAGIAHDFNNALAPILMAGPILRAHLSEPKAQRILDTVGKSAERGAALVRQLLSFARGTVGQSQLVQARHVLQETVELAAATFPKSIRVESHLPADLWPVQGNTTQLNQIFLNLCVNARDAMPQGGELTVTAANRTLDAVAAAGIPDARAGNFLTVEVRDTGTGIPSDVLERIWEPFFTTKGEGRGTGLGLSTVRGIVANHSGFVGVQSRPGRGTTFTVFLPAADRSAGEGPPAAAETPAPRGAGELILVVDDEAPVREIAAQILNRHGYRTLTARDGADAIAVFAPRAAEVRLVLTDLQMPVLDGAALAATLRGLRPALPIVAMSGAGSNANRAYKEFTTAFLAKPFQAETLLAIVRCALDAAPAAPHSAKS